MSLFMKASAFALKEQPVVNAVIDGKDIVYRDYVDISVAVATPSGLMVPVIKNVQKYLPWYPLGFLGAHCGVPLRKSHQKASLLLGKPEAHDQ